MYGLRIARHVRQALLCGVRYCYHRYHRQQRGPLHRQSNDEILDSGRLFEPGPGRYIMEKPDGTAGDGSSIYVSVVGDAKSDMQLQQDWYNAIVTASKDVTLYAGIAQDVKSNFVSLTSYEPTDFTLPNVEDESSPFFGDPPAITAELADGSVGGSCDDHCFKESCEAMGCEEKEMTCDFGEKCKECGSDAMCHSPSFEGCDSTNGGGDNGGGDYGGGNYGGEQEVWWTLKEGPLGCRAQSLVIMGK
eukprot:s18_g7.t1